MVLTYISIYLHYYFQAVFFIYALIWKPIRYILKFKYLCTFYKVYCSNRYTEILPNLCLQSWLFNSLEEKVSSFRHTSIINSLTMVFCYQNCSDLLWEKIVLVIEENFWNSRLSNLFKQWKVRAIFGNRMLFKLVPGGFSYLIN